jgi:xylan 1,4-beta-xylosidase
MQGLAPGHYGLEVTRTGYRSNDVYTAYLDMGSPAHLGRQQMETLRSISAGNPELRAVVRVNPDGTFARQFPLSENDVILLELKKL